MSVCNTLPVMVVESDMIVALKRLLDRQIGREGVEIMFNTALWVYAPAPVLYVIFSYLG